MNSENGKTSKPQFLILKRTNKLEWRIGEEIIAISKLTFLTSGKRKKKNSYNNNKY